MKTQFKRDLAELNEKFEFENFEYTHFRDVTKSV